MTAEKQHNKQQLKGVFCGKVKQNYGVNTAINKFAVLGASFLNHNGLTGDECADSRHHGGLDRALHQYPFEHYRYWQGIYPKHIAWCAPGMGENISSIGMTENTVCIGDRYQWGNAIIEVSQPRSPCFKLNKRWGVDDISYHMQMVSRCGWLYRVIETGDVSAQQPLVLIEQVPTPMTIKAVCDVYFGDPLNKGGLIQLSQQDKLSNSWLEKVHKRLKDNTVEPWDKRLYG